MSCAFCTELASPDHLCEPYNGNRILYEDDYFVVLPTVGCLVEGYVMIMPQDHTFSIAQLDKRALRRLAHMTCQLHAQLERIYGKVAIAEHGAVSCDVKGAQCCDHAHLHFIPCGTEEKMKKMCDEYANAQRISGNKPEFLNTIQDIHVYNLYAYILFATQPGYYNIWKSSDGFARQFCRRAAATAHGIPHQYNWKEHFFVDNMRKTVGRLQGKLKFHDLEG